MITINDINDRSYYMRNYSTANKLITEDYSALSLYDQTNDVLYENNIKLKIHNWRGLNTNSNTAYMNALEAFKLLIDKGHSISDIYTECTFLINEIVKVRDAIQLKNSIKYMKNKFKNKLKIKNRIKIPKQESDELANNLDANNKKIEREIIANECFNNLYLESVSIYECDRIIKNYEYITNRFNLDRIFSEYSVGNCDLYDLIYSITECCASFNSPFRNIYNTTLETVWYYLNKKHVNVSKNFIIESVTDYYIFNGGLSDSNIEDIQFIKTVSPIFEAKDFKNIEYFMNKEESQFPLMNFDVIGKNESAAIIDNLVNKEIPITDDTIESIKDDIKFFKKSCADNIDSVNNIPLLSGLIQKISSKYPKWFIDNIQQLFSMIRMGFINIMDKDKAKQFSYIMTDITMEALKTHPTLTDAKKFKDAYAKEIVYMVNKQSKGYNNEICEKYIKTLKKCILRIEGYCNIVEDKQTDLLTDIEMTEDKIKSLDLEESARIILVHNLISSILENCNNIDASIIICNNINKFTNEMMDILVDLSNSNPDIIPRDILKESIKMYIQSLKESDSIVNYIKISELNDNLYKLNHSPIVYNVNPSIHQVINHLTCLNELKRISLLENNSEDFNFINMAKMLINESNTEWTMGDNNEYINNTLQNVINDISSNNEFSIPSNILDKMDALFSRIINNPLHSRWVYKSLECMLYSVGEFFTTDWCSLDDRMAALYTLDALKDLCYNKSSEIKDNPSLQIALDNLRNAIIRVYNHIDYKMEYDNNNSNILLNISNNTPKEDEYENG